MSVITSDILFGCKKNSWTLIQFLLWFCSLTDYTEQNHDLSEATIANYLVDLLMVRKDFLCFFFFIMLNLLENDILYVIKVILHNTCVPVPLEGKFQEPILLSLNTCTWFKISNNSLSGIETFAWPQPCPYGHQTR